MIDSFPVVFFEVKNFSSGTNPSLQYRSTPGVTRREQGNLRPLGVEG